MAVSKPPQELRGTACLVLRPKARLHVPKSKTARQSGVLKLRQLLPFLNIKELGRGREKRYLV